MRDERPGADDLIIVRSHKYDGRLHRQWRARVTAQAGSLVVLDGAFEKEVQHPLLGTIVQGTLSTEYYWTDRWYSVFRFAEPTGELRCYYCNVNLPIEFDGESLVFIDLDIDVLVAPDFSYQVLDEDEFDANCVHFDYPPEVLEFAYVALEELVALIEAREFPFA